MMKKFLVFFLFSLSITSCERAFFDEEYDEEDPFVSFDYLWEQVDRHYSYFEVKNINWVAMKDKYRSQLSQGMPKEQLFSVMGSMLTELRDDHANLESSFNVAFFGVKFEGNDNYDRRIVEDNYIGRDYQVSGPFIHDFIANGEIGYIRLSAFTGTVDKVNLDYVFGRYQGAKGLIIDLRENGGGSIRDVFAIVGRLINQNTLVYKSRIRNGKGHDDFSDFEDAIAAVADGPRFANKPAMVLVDRGTYSAGSFTSLAIKALPNVVLMGDTTGGGLGLPNGGYLPNGWFYRFSITQAVTVDQANRYEAGQRAQVNAENYENGVPPDIVVSLDRTDITKDEIIDRAVLEILN